MFNLGLSVMVRQLGQMDPDMRGNLETDNLMDKVVIWLFNGDTYVGQLNHMCTNMGKAVIPGVLASMLEIITLESGLTIRYTGKALIPGGSGQDVGDHYVGKWF